MKNKKAELFVISSLFLNCLGVVAARTTQQPETKSAPNGCEQFKGIVIEPDKTSDQKMRIIKPNDAEDYKGIVVNPCEKKIPVVVLPFPSRGKLHLNQTVQTPTLTDKNSAGVIRLKPLTEMISPAEMLQRARQAAEQKK